jgi:hypothetical protein
MTTAERARAGRHAERKRQERLARELICPAGDPEHHVTLYVEGYAEAYCRHGRLLEKRGADEA